jgi:hypothetical protein
MMEKFTLAPMITKCIVLMPILAGSYGATQPAGVFVLLLLLLMAKSTWAQTTVTFTA